MAARSASMLRYKHIGCLVLTIKGTVQSRISMEGCYLHGKAEVLPENLSQCHHVHHNSYTD